MPLPEVYRSAAAITPGVSAKPGSGFRVACQTAGYFVLIMDDGSLYTFFANPGTSGEDGIAVSGVATTGVPSPAGVGTVTILR